jgi:hypothetical protein
VSVNRASTATTLSRLVVEALVKIGLTEKDVLGGAFQHTDLPWQVPPLVIEATLFGAALSEYIDVPTYVHVDHLINLFTDALNDMRNNPRKVLTPDGYKATGLALPHTRASERHLTFSMPDGFPGSVSEYAGTTLGLECAHLLRTNAKVTDFVSDDDNYYAVLPSGTEIGVKDGMPTWASDQWDFPVSGMVQELLRSPRGAVWEGCDYNVIARVRDVAYTYQKHIVEFEAVDWALQALRVIDGERELLRAVKSIKKVAYERTERMAALRQAVEISKMMAISDRQRVETLKTLLVPDILKPGQFSKYIYTFYGVVPVLVAGQTMMKIQENVAALLEQEEALYMQENPAKSLPTGDT